MYLVVGHFLAQQCAAEAMDDLFGLPVSDGTVAEVITPPGQAVGRFIDLVEALLCRAYAGNTDDCQSPYLEREAGCVEFVER
ncbi:hypothetical protein AB0B31_11460 [Catellatospora citrea]|uniref:hypothetical protein n=1 Tax=Catellatospora citrea TaxID=53366 RepID=UPI0033F063CB